MLKLASKYEPHFGTLYYEYRDCCVHIESKHLLPGHHAIDHLTWV